MFRSLTPLPKFLQRQFKEWLSQINHGKQENKI